jgi:LytR cell envelope-related transcriptional attenuator
MDLVLQAGTYAGGAALVGLVVFLPLFLSQARDIRRLRMWSEQEPNAVDEAERVAVASARVAQRAAVARVTGEAEAARAEVRGMARDAQALEARSPAERVAADRPTATRLTREGAALERESRWRGWLRRGPNARQLMWIVAGVFALGLAVALVSLQIAGGGDDTARAPEPTVQQAGVIKGDVEVAVLNGTAVAGLAAKVGDDVDANGYALGAVTNSESPADETMVAFERGHEEEARAVANDLGVDRVSPVDSATSALADGADVVVVAGEDRARF